MPGGNEPNIRPKTILAEFQVAIERKRNSTVTEDRRRLQFMAIHDLMKLGVEYDLTSRTAVKTALSWQARFGDVLCFDQHFSESLRDTVAVDIRWTVELFRRVLCHAPSTEISLRRALPESLQQSFNRFQRQGELALELAGWLFQDLVQEGKQKVLDLRLTLAFLESCGMLFGAFSVSLCGSFHSFKTPKGWAMVDPR